MNHIQVTFCLDLVRLTSGHLRLRKKSRQVTRVTSLLHCTTRHLRLWCQLMTMASSLSGILRTASLCPSLVTATDPRIKSLQVALTHLREDLSLLVSTVLAKSGTFQTGLCWLTCSMKTERRKLTKRLLRCAASMIQKMKKSSFTLHTSLLLVGIEEFVFGRMKKKSLVKLSRTCLRRTRTLQCSQVTKMISCLVSIMAVLFSQVDMMELS